MVDTISSPVLDSMQHSDVMALWRFRNRQIRPFRNHWNLGRVSLLTRVQSCDIQMFFLVAGRKGIAWSGVSILEKQNHILSVPSVNSGTSFVLEQKLGWADTELWNLWAVGQCNIAPPVNQEPNIWGRGSGLVSQVPCHGHAIVMVGIIKTTRLA